MQAPPLSLYVHLPWCVRKCPYCDFNSYSTDNAPRARYLQSLQSDLEHEAGKAEGREIVSIFIGGGTPSLFSPAEIESLLQSVDRHFDCATDIEVTMEANPGTVECGDPAGYRSAGVNRLSIGAQSFSARQLQTLGRIHSVDDIRRAVDDARQAGFDNINLDVMHALPGQTVEAALADLEAAMALGPQHVSWYQLTLEPNTVFHARPPSDMPDQERAWDIQQKGHALLDANGFEQYEVSAYARDGHRCRHNLNYWSFGDYLAAGAGAHGKLTTGSGIVRYAKPANPQAYMNERSTPGPTVRVLEGSELIFEYMLNAVRLSDGFDESEFVARTGLTAEALADAAKSARGRGLIDRNAAGHWSPTDLGKRFLNDLQAEFLPD